MHGHAQTLEDVGDGIVGHGHAQHPFDAGAPQGNLRRRRQGLRVTGVDQGTRAAAHHFHEQLRGPLHGRHLSHRGGVALETMGGVGVQPQAARLQGNSLGREPGALEEDVAALFRDAGIQTAHDPGQRHGTAFIGNHQGIANQGDRVTIEHGQLLALHRQAHVNRLVEAIQVEGVHGLAQLQHHVVADVHHRADGAYAASAQALLHPHRRACRPIDVADHAPHVARTMLRRIQMHRKGVIDDRCHGRHGRPGQGDPVGDGYLPGHPRDPQAIAAVRRQLDVDDDVVEAQMLGQRLAHGSIRIQAHDAVRVLAQTQLAGRAQHALGLDAADAAAPDLVSVRQPRPHQRHGRAHARVHVVRAAHHAQGFAAADIHRAQGQAIGLRVWGDLDHLRHHDFAHGRRQRCGAVHLETRGGELLDQGVGIHGRIGPFAQPLLADFHRRNCSRKRRSLSKNRRKSSMP